MAAKENQGLQAIVIVLTIFLLLTGVGLLLVNNARKTGVAQVADLQSQISKASGDLAKKDAEVTEYKAWVGFPAETLFESATPEFAADQKRYGSNMEEASRDYRHMLEYIFEENRTLGKNEANAKEQVKEYKDRLAAVEAQKEEQLKAYKSQLDKAEADLAAERVKFEESRKKMVAETDKITADREELQATHDEAVAKLTAEATGFKNTIAKLEQDIDKLKLGLPEVDQFAQPADGRIAWVNQRHGKVWIDLGSADGLRPQVTFSVAAEGSADAEAAAKKGSIEVVRILEPHMAEAQITADDPKNPLMPGDRIYSQVWDRGRQVGFGIAGVVDIDKDRRSDLQQLKDIITANNGRVDASPDDAGKRVGDLKVDTRYLILGGFPEGARDGELRKTWDELGTQAERLGVQTIALDEFLKLMGWRVDNQSVVLGAGSRTEDFPPQPLEQEMPRKPVQPTGVFKKRLPGVSY